MKKAVILHGTDGAPDHNWFPWMKAQLEGRSYEVWVPHLPNSHTPNRQVYNDFLLQSGWDYTDNLVIGHSSGAVSVLNLLADKRCPDIATAVLVGAWSHMDETDLDKEQFKDLFPIDGFSFEVISKKTSNFLFMHGDNDPYCPLDQAKWLTKQTKGDIVVIPDGHHLGFKYTELPELVNAMQERNLL